MHSGHYVIISSGHAKGSDHHLIYYVQLVIEANLKYI